MGRSKTILCPQIFEVAENKVPLVFSLIQGVILKQVAKLQALGQLNVSY